MMNTYSTDTFSIVKNPVRKFKRSSLVGLIVMGLFTAFHIIGFIFTLNLLNIILMVFTAFCTYKFATHPDARIEMCDDQVSLTSTEPVRIFERLMKAKGLVGQQNLLDEYFDILKVDNKRATTKYVDKLKTVLTNYEMSRTVKPSTDALESALAYIEIENSLSRALDNTRNV